MRSPFIITLIVFFVLGSTGGAAIDDNPVNLGNVSLSFAGKFIFNDDLKEPGQASVNGRFHCDYQIGRVGDEIRELKRFRFYDKDQELFSMDTAPGSDLYISNSGYIAFMDMTHHYRGDLKINFYSSEGRRLFSKDFKSAALFGFSETGNKFVVVDEKGTQVIDIPGPSTSIFPHCDQFAFSGDENSLALARTGVIEAYSGGRLIKSIPTDDLYPRGLEISVKHDILAVINKHFLNAYSISNGGLLFSDRLGENLSFRDLILKDDKILTGVEYRDKSVIRGILKVFDLNGRVLHESTEAARRLEVFEDDPPEPNSVCDYPEICWPFVPFDSMRTVWNYYEQHMSYGTPDWSYLHQGLDLIVPIDEPTYTVEGGVVKCVLTISGDQHWRVAVSPEQTALPSDGWLYAHLVESSIAVDVGDTVDIHDYLGDIVYWTHDWGHIHFVEIRDSGMVWHYFDDEWGINYNPLHSLRPDTDTIPPVIEDVFAYSKFGFCLNETSTYLRPDNLHGDIDIITKVVDYIGDSEWQQPAYETFYWIKKLPEEVTIFPRTMGHILNHTYPFYGTGSYEPFAIVIYKRDNYLLPPSWMEPERDYYHVLTNSDGDSIIELSERNLSFPTADYPNGDYRIFVEATDIYGNSCVDSQDVIFNNGLSGVNVYMAPEHPPVVVPAGGSFSYAGILQNNTNLYQIGDVWIMLTIPDGRPYGPLDRYNNVMLSPHQTVTIPGIVQHVPQYAPEGAYRYIAYGGNYPSAKSDSASFEFIVGTPSGTGSGEWVPPSWFNGDESLIAGDIDLPQNYPNPFNSKTQIMYALPSNSDVRLDIFNLMGQKVERLVDAKQNAGQHVITWNARDYSSGIYFYILKISDRILAGRMTLIK